MNQFKMKNGKCKMRAGFLSLLCILHFAFCILNSSAQPLLRGPGTTNSPLVKAAANGGLLDALTNNFFRVPVEVSTNLIITNIAIGQVIRVEIFATNGTSVTFPQQTAANTTAGWISPIWSNAWQVVYISKPAAGETNFDVRPIDYLEEAGANITITTNFSTRIRSWAATGGSQTNISSTNLLDVVTAYVGLANGDVWTWNSAANKWTNSQPPGAAGGVDKLDGVATNLTVYANSPALTVIPKIGGNSNSFQVLNTNGQRIVYVETNGVLNASNTTLKGTLGVTGASTFSSTLTGAGLFDSTIANGNRVMLSEATPTGQILESAISGDELTHLSGVTAAIQTQLGAATNRTESKQSGTASLTNLAGLVNTVFTNQPAGGTNIAVRTVGGTNFFDVIIPPESGIHTFTSSLAATNDTANTNIIVDMRVKTTRLSLTNNATFTNWIGNAATTSGSFALIIQPQLINRTIVWPAISTPIYGLYFRTNSGSTLWTTLSNGVEYWLTGDRHDTNIVLTLSVFQ